MADPTPAAGAAVTNGAAGTPAPTAADWLAGTETDLRGFAELKGWKSPGDAIKSYREYEKWRGVPQDRILALPEKLDDDAALAPILGRLGRPEKPDGYGIEGIDPEFLAEVHKAGLTTRQAKHLHGVLTGRAKAAQEAADAKLSEQIGLDMAELQREWGNEYAPNEQHAKRAVQAMGVSPEQLDKLERALGTKWVYQTFSRIGRGLAEGSFVEGSPDRAASGGGFGMTAAAARAKVDQLMASPEFQARLTSPVAATREAAIQERRRLLEVAQGG